MPLAVRIAMKRHGRSSIDRLPRRLRRRFDGLDRQRRRQHAGASVLIGDRGAERDGIGAAVESVDEGGVFLGDKAAADSLLSSTKRRTCAAGGRVLLHLAISSRINRRTSGLALRSWNEV